MSLATTSYLKEAVHHHAPASRRGMLERLFTLWFRGFVYNQIWEDPRVDLAALQLTSDSRVLTISSGGCNVLNYLLQRPRHITAIDLNTSHMCLTRLKIAAVRHMPDHEAFYSFFGVGRHADNLRHYHQYIRPHLDEVTRRFWEGRTLIGGRVGRRRIDYFARGLYDHAKLGRFLRLTHGMARLMRRDPRQLLEARTMADQQAFFHEVIEPFFNNRLVRWMGGSPVAVFSLGIPPSQHQVMHEESGGRLLELYRQRLYKLACGFPLDDNYFAWQAFGRRYDHVHRSALPDYLRAENFDTLRQHLDRVSTHITSLTEFLHQQQPGSFDRFVLLDSQDWMPPAVIAQLWEQIARVGAPGTRIIFRTAGEKSPIEAALPPTLMRRFVCEREQARQLHERDRSAIYGMFHLYRLAPRAAPSSR